MLTVVTPASSFRLTTAQRAAEAGVAGVTDVLLDAASDSIARGCDRIFGRQVVRETLGWCSGGQRLTFPATSIVSVTAGGILLDPTLYGIDPRDGRLHRLSAAGQQIGWGYGPFEVIYTSGWILPGDEAFATAVPADRLPPSVEQACILTLAAWRAGQGRDPMLRSESTEGVGSAAWIATAEMGALPPQATALLAPFLVWSVA